MRFLTVMAIVGLIALPSCSGSDSTDGSGDEGAPPADTRDGGAVSRDEGAPPKTDPGPVPKDKGESDPGVSGCEEGAREACTNENEHGSCDGERTCLADKTWGDCDAPEAAAETCNALDDDCDGESDEGLPNLCNCGDGVCSGEGGENVEGCPCDCKQCGDGVCSPCGESPVTCKEDCCRTPDGPSVCGDGFCLGYGCGENPSTCSADCGRTCGNGSCERGENPAACPKDCKRQVCGNGVCEPTDGGPDECDDCSVSCGDCICQGTEGWLACPIDCGFCGDGVCTTCARIAEDEESCPMDCREGFEPPGPVGCAPRLRPETIRLGLVEPMGQAYMEVAVVNMGDGACVPLPDDLKVIDCLNPLSGAQPCLPGIPAEPPTPSQIFFVHPDQLPEQLGPGEELTLFVSFSTPPFRKLVGGSFEELTGLLTMAFEDPASDEQKTIYVPEGYEADTEHETPPNLTVSLGLRPVATSTSSVSVGEVALGCSSAAQRFVLANRGANPLDIAMVGFDPLCADPFGLVDVPGGPFSIDPLGGVDLGITFTPPSNANTEHSTSCNVRVVPANQAIPEISFEVWGMATENSERKQRLFSGAFGTQADILFVIDDSAAMANKRKALADAIRGYFGTAQQGDMAFRMAFTTTNVQADNGRFGSDPRIVSSAVTVSQLADAVEAIGGNEASDALAFAAALKALTLPNTFVALDEENQQIPCDSPDTCAPHGCYPPIDQSSSAGGICGEPNWGFLRSGVPINIVIVTDRDDASEMEPGAYVQMLSGASQYDPGAVRIHAMAGDVPGGCTSPNGDAVAAENIKKAVDATGGEMASICGAGQAPPFEGLFDALFGAKTRYPLNSAPSSDGVTVTKDGEPCADGWVYDVDTRSIVFERTSPCLPGASGGQSYEATYEAECE
jgi:hypothetical protein